VESDAVLLGEEAIRSEREDVLVRVFGSTVGVVVVVMSGFLLWELFKRRYHEKALNSRPEVVSSET
jgi:cytoskeletal protein RodZ